MSAEALRAQLAILDKLLADTRKAREERTAAWYARQFGAQLDERQTSLRVIHPEQAAA